jgi:hypothetical protein
MIKLGDGRYSFITPSEDYYYYDDDDCGDDVFSINHIQSLSEESEAFV